MRRAELAAWLRALHARPGGTGMLLNVLRGEAIRAGTDILLLTELVCDPRMQRDLIRHGVDEAQHARCLLERMQALGAAPSRLPPALDRLERLADRSRARDPKQVHADRSPVRDAEVLELLTLASVREAAAAEVLRAHADALGGDPETRALLHGILADEERHAAYLAGWLERFACRFSPRTVTAARLRLEAAQRELDVAWYAAVEAELGRAAA